MIRKRTKSFSMETRKIENLKLKLKIEERLFPSFSSNQNNLKKNFWTKPVSYDQMMKAIVKT